MCHPLLFRRGHFSCRGGQKYNAEERTSESPKPNQVEGGEGEGGRSRSLRSTASMKSHPSEDGGGEIILEKGHGTNPPREDAISSPLLSNEESVLRRFASLSLSSFHLPFPSFVS